MEGDAKLRRFIPVAIAVGVVLVRFIGPSSTEPITLQSAMSDVALGAYDPRGFQFRYVEPDTGEPVRYDACSQLHYVINPDLAPAGGIDDVHTAVQETSKATGIKFVYDGETDEQPTAQRAAYQPDRYGERWAPVLIAWAPTLGMPEDPSAEAAGLAGSEFRTNEDGETVYVTGSATFNSSTDLDSGYAGQTWGQVIVHEMGHVVGLDHVEDPMSVMHPRVTLRPATWGDGDRRGLWELGLGRECVETPELP